MIHVESKDNNNKVSISIKGKGGDLVAEWAAVTESMFDHFIENTSVEFAKEIMKRAFKEARKTSIKNHEGNEGKSTDLFEQMGIGSMDEMFDRFPELGELVRALDKKEED